MGWSNFSFRARRFCLAHDTADAMAALDLPDGTLATIARRARERTLAEHTAQQRAREMVAAFEQARTAAA